MISKLHTFYLAIISLLAAFLGYGVAEISAQSIESTNSNTTFLSFSTEDETNNIDIYRKASPSVVYVTNSAIKRVRSGFFSYNVQEIPQGTGTGFVWDKNGLIVTNFHVIQGASKVTITLGDQTRWDAQLVGTAPEKDLAVLKIEAKSDQLTPLPIGSSDALEVGRKVLAIGNPFGLDTTLTVGVISALGREINSFNNRKIRDVIQTDAAINPGNSGGPLLNSQGQLIGVNTAIFSGSGGGSIGIGFAIPVNTVKKIVPQLIRYGKLFRPVLGINPVPDVYAKRNNIKGVIVENTQRGLPAEQAGIVGLSRNRRGELVVGDVITAINDQPIENNDDLLTVLEQFRPNDDISIITQRQGQELKFNIKLARPQD